MDHTERGFAFHVFTDYNREECSLQKSSLATDMRFDGGSGLIIFGA